MDRQRRQPRHRLRLLRRHTANLANGAPLERAVAAAKRYVAGALRAGPAVDGKGVGPMHHGYALRQGPQ